MVSVEYKSSGIKNTDAEIRDGIWGDSTKANGADVASIKAKTDRLPPDFTSGTLNDETNNATISPANSPCSAHVTLDLSTIIVADDDFTLEVKVGVGGSERVVGYYKVTSDGSDTSIDTGSGTASKTKVRRTDISDIMIYTGEQLRLDYTKNSDTSRDVLYRFNAGV